MCVMWSVSCVMARQVVGSVAPDPHMQARDASLHALPAEATQGDSCPMLYGMNHLFHMCMLGLHAGFADKFDYTLFDIPDLDYSTRTYGKAILAVYTILSGILLGNLLIAIITYRWVQPHSRWCATRVYDACPELDVAGGREAAVPPDL